MYNVHKTVIILDIIKLTKYNNNINNDTLTHNTQSKKYNFEFYHKDEKFMEIVI